MSDPLFKKKGSSVWWCRIPNPSGGRHLRESTGQRDRTAALAEWRRKCRESVVGPNPAKDCPPLFAAVDAFLEERKRAGKAAGTIDSYTKKGRHVVRVLGPLTPLNSITAVEVDSFIDTRLKENAARSSVAKELVVLGGALRHARRRKEYAHPVDEVMPVEFSPGYKPKDRVLTVAEVEALFGVLLPKRAAVVAFIVATGATYPSEVAPIRDGDLDGVTIRLRGTKRETRDRLVPVPMHARRWLALAKKSTPFEPWTNIRGDLHDAARLLSMCAECRLARLAWARHEEGATRPSKDPCDACSKATPFEPLSPNDLRRTFGHMLRALGHPPHLIGLAMGHRDSRMAERVYAKLKPQDLAKLLFRGPAGGQPRQRAAKTASN